jgi:membrane associated rhomboid family serine protease
MTPSPVGMRCPECAGQRTKVTTAAAVRTGGATEPYVTYALIVLCVLAFVGEMAGGAGLGFGRAGGTFVEKGALFGPAIEFRDEYWRLITGGFLHAGFLHIAFNMYLLWILGQMLEPSLGKLRFGAIYFTSLLTGAFGAILLSSPGSYTVGASGAVFGLMGAGVVFLHARGINPMESGLGPTILINLLFPFLFPGLNVSIGGHLFGLAGGFLSGWIITRAAERHSSPVLPILACVVISAIALAATYYEAREKVGLV